MLSLRVSVVLPTHQPHLARLLRTLNGLREQTLPVSEWELLVIDNGSDPALTSECLSLHWQPAARVIRENELGLTPARIRGFVEARNELIVMVDDDNVLAPNYLALAAERFEHDPTLGAAGGPSRPEFESPPPPWTREFWEMLALRDLGDVEMITAFTDCYPECAPIGAGMALRREAALAWAEEIRVDPFRRQLDRRGTALVSGGDNDVVLAVLKGGWHVAYFPDWELTHLIPDSRLTADYLTRLAESMNCSWMRLLTWHGVNPHAPLSRVGAALRKAKAFFTRRAWAGPAERIRWRGACGHFEGRTVNHF